MTAELEKEVKANFSINDEVTGRVILSLGAKGSGKTHFLNTWLKYAMKHKLFDIYCLVLPAFDIEADSAYSFIDQKDPDILIFTEYNESIPLKIMKSQRKKQAKKNQQKDRIFFCVDDSSGEQINSFQMDNNLKRLITSVRHFNCIIHIIAHAVGGTLSTFMRSNVDILILYNVTSMLLLESIYDEFLSLNQKFRAGTRSASKSTFVDAFLTLNEKPYQCMFLNLRNRFVSYDLFEVAKKLK